MADDFADEWDDPMSADYHAGFDAGEAGEPDDGTRSPQWREGHRDGRDSVKSAATGGRDDG